MADSYSVLFSARSQQLRTAYNKKTYLLINSAFSQIYFPLIKEHICLTLAFSSHLTSWFIFNGKNKNIFTTLSLFNLLPIVLYLIIFVYLTVHLLYASVGNHYQSHSKGMNDKDLLLENLTKGKPDSYFTAEGINKYLFKNMNIDQVNNIILEIRKEKPELIKDFLSLNRIVGIQGTGMIESFLKNGVFTKIERIEKEKTIKEKEIKKIELNLAKSNIKANKLNEKNSCFNKWTTIVNIIIGLLNIGILIWQAMKD